MTRTTHIIEHSPPPEIREEKFIEKIETKSMSDAPRSVREWDALKVERSPSPARSHRSHRSRSRHHSHSHSRRASSPVFKEEVFEKKEIREMSPGARSSRSRRPSSPHGTEIIEKRREIIEDDRDESSSIHAGPLALVLPERHRKSEKDLSAEIRALEAERRALKLEREVDRERSRGDREIILRGDREYIIEGPRREVIVERPPEEVVEVKKDRKGRMSLVVKR